MSSKKCPACGRLNFSDAEACYGCEASLDSTSVTGLPPRDAFHKQTASFNDDWGGASAPDASELHDIPRTSFAGAIGGSSSDWLSENLVGILVFGVCLLFVVADGCGEDEEDGYYGSGGYYYTGSGASGGPGYAPGDKSSRAGSTGSRWGSGGGFGFGK
jgi:hypothetical protein